MMMLYKWVTTYNVLDKDYIKLKMKTIIYNFDLNIFVKSGSK